MLELWPIALTAGATLIGWGTLNNKVDNLRKDVDAKASKDTFEQMDARLARIEGQVDRLVTTLVERN